ncbi:MAG: arginine repressor [Clostridia bacterium]|nr:arginine repressor [Clostridia bacterium]
MKSKRQEKILELISEFEIETQEELIFYLNKYGFETTQATISRDIRELKLTKIVGSTGNYRYAAGHRAEVSNPTPKFNGVLVDSIIKVSYANNIIVLKTFPGLANAIGSGIDAIHSPDILGCVAGDDTVIIVLKNELAAKETSEKLKQMMRSV